MLFLYAILMFLRRTGDRSDAMRERVRQLSESSDYREVLRAARLAKQELANYSLASQLVDKYETMVKSKYEDNPSIRNRLLGIADREMDYIFSACADKRKARRQRLR